ncbi:MAG: hypothetical protein Q8L06_10625, partial [Pseudohongiella sp.]|nr:hypothetical protein [Pseudohongiella sp.]
SYPATNGVARKEIADFSLFSSAAADSDSMKTIEVLLLSGVKLSGTAYAGESGEQSQHADQAMCLYGDGAESVADMGAG